MAVLTPINVKANSSLEFSCLYGFLFSPTIMSYIENDTFKNRSLQAVHDWHNQTQVLNPEQSLGKGNYHGLSVTLDK